VWAHSSLTVLQYIDRCYTLPVVTPSTKKQTAFRIDPEILDGLRTVKERDGVPVSEQVRRALVAWLDEKGVTRADRKRVGPRKRS
jgi:hypothetical protein